MTGPFLALAASLSWGVGDFLAGLSSRKLQLLTVLVVSQAAGLTSLAVLVAGRASGPPEARYLLYAGLAGIAGAIGLAALYRGLAVGSMSVVAPISATAAVIPVVAGLITGERPSAAQGAGIALALAGVVLASRERRADADALWATLSMRGTSFTLLAITALVVRPSLSLGRNDLAALALIGVLDAAGNALFALATTESLLSVAAVLAQLYPVVTVLLARVVLGERISRLQQAGVVSAFAGIALITAG